MSQKALESLHRREFVAVYCRIVDIGPALATKVRETGCRAFWPEKCANTSVVVVCIR